MNERIEKIIGLENIDKIKNTKVLIVGIGGVGGITFEMLVRSGIENIDVIDYDVFEESNLNRQILCTMGEIGNYKVYSAKQRALSINPNCNVKTYNESLNNEAIHKLDTNYDYIVDACDNVNAKVLLVSFAITNNIKIISCCGTGNRLDSTKLQITNIWKTEYDPLSKKFRSELRKNNINYKLPVVTSTERPVVKIKGTIASMAMVPNAAGILLSNYVINDILNN